MESDPVKDEKEKGTELLQAGRRHIDQNCFDFIW